MNEETTIYQQGSIKITNLRAIFAEKTYSISNITAVETKTIEPNKNLEFVLLFAGLSMFVCGVTDPSKNIQWLIFGVLALVIFYFMYRASRSTYAVNITTASGEVKAYTSQDQAAIQTIVQALNTAIVQKG